MTPITFEQILNIDPFLNGMFVVLFIFTAVVVWQQWRGKPKEEVVATLKTKKSA